MSTTIKETRAEKLRTAFELFEAGLEMKRASIRRLNPDLNSQEVDFLLHKWLRARRLPMEGVAGYRVRESRG